MNSVPFNEAEAAGFTATTLNLLVPPLTAYDPDIIDKPQREKINYSLHMANKYNWARCYGTF
jgi:hypothetical protein